MAVTIEHNVLFTGRPSRDFNDLYFFAAVVKNGGFSAAARALGVPKSRLSRRVAVLEAQLGVRLLERSARRFSVTDVGQQIYQHARAAVSEAEAVDDIALRMLSQPQGLVRISCPLGARRSISEALPAFLTRYPLLRVHVVLTNRAIDLVDEGVDIAIRIRDRLDTDGDLPMKRIGTSRRILVASKALLESLGRPGVPADLARFPTVDTRDQIGPATWLLTGPGGARESIGIAPRIGAGDFGVVLYAALHSVGVALVPELHCRYLIESGDLEHVLPGWEAKEGIVHLVFTSRRGMLPSVRAVINFISETLSQPLASPADDIQPLNSPKR